jgi:hypothetical protein
MCKGYGSRIPIQAQLTTSTNNTDTDIIPRLREKNSGLNNTFKFTVEQYNSSSRLSEGS